MANPHMTYPLRRIASREVQNGNPMVVLVCGHAVPGLPSSRYSRFFPCCVCHEQVEKLKRSRAA